MATLVAYVDGSSHLATRTWPPSENHGNSQQNAQTDVQNKHGRICGLKRLRQ